MAEPTLFKDGLARWSTSTANEPDAVIAGVKSVEIPLSKAELANAVMGDDVEAMFPGLISAPISVTLRQDFTTAAAGVDLQSWTRWNDETKFQFEAAPVNAVLSATNPAYRFDRVGMFNFTPISGAHGVLLENPIQLRMLSGCAVTRETASSS